MSSVKHSPRTRNFLDALMALCRRHGLFLIVDEDTYAVVPLTAKEQLQALDHARDDVQGLPIFTTLAIALGDDGMPARMRRASDTASPDIRELLQTAAEEIIKLRRGLSQAIAEADHWYGEAHDADGIPMLIETPEMDALRLLLPAGARA